MQTEDVGKLKIKCLVIYLILLSLLQLGCDSNPLGGSKSQLQDNYEPGKKSPSASPVISNFPDFSMDQDDVQTISFTIADADTFMMCSSIYVRAVSSNKEVIDYQDMVIGGEYPNCTLRLTPKPGKFGAVAITVEVYDFWTIASSTFALNVLQVFTPGTFAISDAEGADKSILVTWSTPTNMTGTSAVLSMFYKNAVDSTYVEIKPVASPYLLTGLTNGEDYDIYIRAKNSVGQRDTAVVRATPTRFRVQGGEFVAGSVQHVDTVGGGSPINYKTFATTGTKTDEVKVTTTPRGYKVYLNSQGNIISGTGP